MCFIQETGYFFFIPMCQAHSKYKSLLWLKGELHFPHIQSLKTYPWERMGKKGSVTWEFSPVSHVIDLQS